MGRAARLQRWPADPGIERASATTRTRAGAYKYEPRPTLSRSESLRDPSHEGCLRRGVAAVAAVARDVRVRARRLGSARAGGVGWHSPATTARLVAQRCSVHRAQGIAALAPGIPGYAPQWTSLAGGGC
eukprot:scaffold27_cov355-Prasinococcus_capsulatus_cf.AAC.10